MSEAWPPPPRLLEPRLHARLPDPLRRRVRTPWADANLGGRIADSFLEGPCFDAAGVLHVVDIPHGRVLRVTATGAWEEVAAWDGWPNGLALRPQDGALLVADHRLGLLSLDVATGRITKLLDTALSEGFKGLNDLVVAADGAVLFTDQGQTGLQDPTGRVWRLRPDGGLDRLLGTCPSPNGIAVNRAGTHAYVAMTRSCEIWRFALRPADGLVGKAQLFCRLPGGIAGPDGLAMDADERLFVAHPGHGQVWGLDPHGLPVLRVDCLGFGRMPTNLCLAPDQRTLLVTESASGCVLAVDLPEPA